MNQFIDFLLAPVMYGIVGNSIVFLLVAKAGIETSTFRKGTYGYSYRVVSGNPNIFGPGVRFLALSANLVLVFAFIAVVIGGSIEHRT